MSTINVKSICENCGTVGFPIKKLSGAFWVTVLLWIVGLSLVAFTLGFSLLIPIAYIVHRHSTYTAVCYNCGGRMIPLYTPGGKELMKKFGIEEEKPHIEIKEPPIEEEISYNLPENNEPIHHKISEERKKELKEKYNL